MVDGVTGPLLSVVLLVSYWPDLGRPLLLKVSGLVVGIAPDAAKPEPKPVPVELEITVMDVLGVGLPIAPDPAPLAAPPTPVICPDTM